jgi:hypothetical protein
MHRAQCFFMGSGQHSCLPLNCPATTAASAAFRQGDTPRGEGRVRETGPLVLLVRQFCDCAEGVHAVGRAEG